MSRFVIVNEFDRPYARNVAELVEGIGYCYMFRASDKLLKQFDGMDPKRPTAIEMFGIRVRISGSDAIFTCEGASEATYSDGKNRRWDGEASFTLPLVIGVKKLGKRVA